MKTEKEATTTIKWQEKPHDQATVKWTKLIKFTLQFTILVFNGRERVKHFIFLFGKTGRIANHQTQSNKIYILLVAFESQDTVQFVVGL